MKLINALPEPLRNLPSAIVDYPEALQRLRASGWWNQARLRTYWCQAVKPHLLAELVDIAQNPVLLVRTDAETFDALPEGFRQLPFAQRREVANKARRLQIRAEWEAWPLNALAQWRDAAPGLHDDLVIPAVCRCGRHDLDLSKVLADHENGDRRRVVLPRNGHSV